jgi:opacity protein-like surface antigen
LVYAVAKSIREISPYEKIAGINKAADVIRGGLKLTAGTLSASAGAITAWLDITSGSAELNKDKSDEVLVGIYFGRAAVGIASSALGLIAAFSYSAPLLWRLAGSQLMSKSVIALRLVTLFASSAVIAESLALTRTLMLIRLARFNMIGVAITLVEVGYRVFIKDDELENWLQACTFRLDKDGWLSEKPFPNVEVELSKLRSAVKAVSL